METPFNGLAPDRFGPPGFLQEHPVHAIYTSVFAFRPQSNAAAAVAGN